jgi:hypothetical protein
LKCDFHSARSAMGGIAMCPAKNSSIIDSISPLAQSGALDLGCYMSERTTSVEILTRAPVLVSIRTNITNPKIPA